MPEQRRTYRKRSFMAAYVGMRDASTPLFCLVRDVSPTGARLELIGAPDLPDRFDLTITGRDRLYSAEVVWRRSNQIGVRFVAKALASDAALCRAS